MDHIKLDQVVDIPDTPDRLSTKNKNVRNGLEKQNSSFKLGQGSLFPEERKNYRDKVQIHPPRSFSNCGKPGHHGNSMGFGFGEPSSSRNGLIFRLKGADKSLVCDNKNAAHLVNGQNKKSLFNSQSSAGRDSAFLELSDKQHTPKLKRAVPSGAPGVSPAELADNHSSSHSRANVPLILKEPNNGRQLQNVDEGDLSLGGVEPTDNSNDPQSNAQKSESTILNSNSIPRAIRQKRLVRNGCISPMNIAKGKQPVEKGNSGPTGMRQSGSVVGSSDASTCSIGVRDIVAEDYNSHSLKGKGLLHRPFSKNVISPPKSTRNSMSINEAGEYLDANNCGEGPSGWRTTHTESRKLNPLVSHRGEDISIEDGGSCFISHRNGNKVRRRENLENTIRIHENSNSQMPDASATFGNTKGGYVAKNDPRAKRHKHGSPSSTNAECSTSAVNDSGSVIHIDEATPEVQHIHPHGSNTDSTDTQVELDEILARELQEQFYSEDPAVGSGEIDAHIALAVQQEESHHPVPVSRRRQPVSDPEIGAHTALALQQEEEPRRSVPRRRQPVANPNGRSRPNLSYAGARATSSNRMARLRNRFPGQPRTISSSRGRNSTISTAGQGSSLFPTDMDVDMRMHILETLESFAHMGAANSFLHLQRDFNENDYEMLLALDENNHQHAGTTARRINDLPQSTVQTERLEEACVICLENPTMGDVIRHLPCLHKFHKDCIDAWLGRSTSCPVCKSSIT